MYNYRATGFGGRGFGQASRPKDPVWCAVNTNDCATCFACCSTNHPRGGVKYNKCLNRCRLRFGAEVCAGGQQQTIPPPTVNPCGIVCTSPGPAHEQCHWECPAGYGPPPPQTIVEYPATRNVILTGSEQTVPIMPQPIEDSGGGILAMVSEYWWVPIAGLIAWKVIGK